MGKDFDISLWSEYNSMQSVASILTDLTPNVLTTRDSKGRL